MRTDARRNAFNDADLRYLGTALLALRHARRESHVAAAWASDPRVRALARRARAAQSDDIGAITSMLIGWGPTEGGPDRAASDTSSVLDGLEIDRHFIAFLIAHAEASLLSTRTEMVEGFGGSSRRFAEDTSRANWRELAALRSLTPAPDHAG